MPRPRQRVRLESGLKLDLNKLLRDAQVKRGQLGRGTYSWRRGRKLGARTSGIARERAMAERAKKIGAALSTLAFRRADFHRPTVFFDSKFLEPI